MWGKRKLMFLIISRELGETTELYISILHVVNQLMNYHSSVFFIKSANNSYRITHKLVSQSSLSLLSSTSSLLAKNWHLHNLATPALIISGLQTHWICPRIAVTDSLSVVVKCRLYTLTECVRCDSRSRVTRDETVWVWLSTLLLSALNPQGVRARIRGMCWWSFYDSPAVFF